MRKVISTAIICFILFNTQITAQYLNPNDSIISVAVAHISKDSIEYQVQWLQDMETRFLMEPNRKQVAEAIKARFESYGMTEVRLDSFECYTNIHQGMIQLDTTTWQYNVEAKITGSLYPDEEIIIVGHHDDMQDVNNSQSYAPGADDNASGTVAALETARVLMQIGYQPEKTIVFLTTAAEELMYFGDAGSEHYANEAAAAGRSFECVINNDMIAYNDGSDIIWISNIIGFEEVTDIVSLVAYQYTSLVIEVSEPIPYYGADLQPFQDQGWPGVALMERTFNPYYHTEQDIIENCDLDYLTEVIKISCGSVIYTDISVGLREVYENEINVQVYPNPCSDHIRINTSQFMGIREIQLFNASGMIVHKSRYSGQEENIELSMTDYPSGMYFLRIIGSEHYGLGKIMKK